jgi:predicted peroxiredoxin
MVEPARRDTILYVITSDDPKRQYPPLMLAQAAMAMGADPRIYYMGDALNVVLPGRADGLQAGSFPPVGEMLRETMDMGVPVYVCKASKEVLGWEDVEFIEGSQVVGAVTLNDMALEGGAIMWF